jgi:hypothetical protein
MAPEAYQGKACPASDIYSLGCTALQLMAEGRLQVRLRELIHKGVISDRMRACMQDTRQSYSSLSPQCARSGRSIGRPRPRWPRAASGAALRPPTPPPAGRVLHGSRASRLGTRRRSESGSSHYRGPCTRSGSWGLDASSHWLASEGYRARESLSSQDRGRRGSRSPTLGGPRVRMKSGRESVNGRRCGERSWCQDSSGCSTSCRPRAPDGRKMVQPEPQQWQQHSMPNVRQEHVRPTAAREQHVMPRAVMREPARHMPFAEPQQRQPMMMRMGGTPIAGHHHQQARAVPRATLRNN